ncbi:hypothetical protein GCK72_000303 [Caenorhabditis remanei]|uniref:Uncharacterized protein n=1 Tax=Caenorhabditis remanei TaxID=31234 RepID=A0A6A5HMS4_CAERE|nr:hypothetical protein GCK72_000303 [Caenorhabditis remanei]KAF1768491.1 hypothetical protein GCK72_000303 [Caenorhabditis remanei]
MLEAIYAKIMGVGSSRHDKRQGCWSWGESSNGEEKRMKRPKKLPSKLRLKISGNQRRRREDTFVVWEEIPTPSVCDHRDTMNSDASSTPSPPSAPTQERLMQHRNFTVSKRLVLKRSGVNTKSLVPCFSSLHLCGLK